MAANDSRSDPRLSSSALTDNLTLRRIRTEMREILEDRNPCYTASPLSDDIFEWHFTIRGPPDSAFEGGVYHGRIILPPEYPKKPPNIVFLTENGRWQTHQKICLSVSAYHPEAWNPAWSIRTVLLAIIGFMPTKAAGAIGALDYPDEDRRRLAQQSLGYACERCGSSNRTALPEPEHAAVQETQRSAQQLLATTEIATTAPVEDSNGRTTSSTDQPSSSSSSSSSSLSTNPTTSSTTTSSNTFSNSSNSTGSGSGSTVSQNHLAGQQQTNQLNNNNNNMNNNNQQQQPQFNNNNNNNNNNINQQMNNNPPLNPNRNQKVEFVWLDALIGFISILLCYLVVTKLELN